MSENVSILGNEKSFFEDRPFYNKNKKTIKKYQKIHLIQREHMIDLIMK